MKYFAGSSAKIADIKRFDSLCELYCNKVQNI